jgi:hypothetical protein
LARRILLTMGENADAHLRLLALHTTRRSVRTRLLDALPSSIWSPGTSQTGSVRSVSVLPLVSPCARSGARDHHVCQEARATLSKPLLFAGVHLALVFSPPHSGQLCSGAPSPPFPLRL